METSDKNPNEETQTKSVSERVSKHEIIITKAEKNKSKKGVKILLIVLGVLLLAGIGAGIFLWKLHIAHNDSLNEDAYIVLAGKLNLVEKSKNAQGAPVFNFVKALPFATKVVLNTEKVETQNEKTYYKLISYSVNSVEHNCKKEAYYLEATMNELENGYYEEAFLNLFPVKEVQQLPAQAKKALYECLVKSNNENYQFTQDANRIATSLVKADFNMDGEQDIAVLFESPNREANRIIILCYNSDMQKYYEAFYDSNYNLATIKLFGKEATIFMNSETLVKSPNNGIIYEMQTSESGYNKYAILYNPQLRQFKQYLQVPQSEMEREVYEEGDCCGEPEVVAAADSLAVVVEAVVEEALPAK